MAIVLLNSEAFDYRQIDLHSVLGTRSLIGVEAAPTYLTSGIGFTVGAVNNIIQGHAIFPDLHVEMDTATAHSFHFWGHDMGPNAPFPTGALLRLDGAWYASGDAIDIAGVLLDPSVFFAAADTASVGDDMAVWRSAFRNNDYIGGSLSDDAFYLGRGNDIYVDQGGQDVVKAGPGDDFVLAGVANNGIFNDLVVGGQGNDILSNDYGTGRLRGGQGNDTLIGNYGDDVMLGGAGSDVFVFEAADGTHRILDFNAATDQIVAPDGVSALGYLTILQIGNRAVVSHGDWTLILANVDAADLNGSNLLFGGTVFSEAVQNGYLAGYAYDV